MLVAGGGDESASYLLQIVNKIGIVLGLVSLFLTTFENSFRCYWLLEEIIVRLTFVLHSCTKNNLASHLLTA